MTALASKDIATSSRRWRVPAGAVTALALPRTTAVRNPYESGAFPSCIFYQATGWYCPGCGGLRATHELLHGDVAACSGHEPPGSCF